MADQLISTTESSAIVPEIWSAKFYEVLLAKLPFMDSVDREYEGEISNLGDIVNISSIPEFSEANELAEGEKGEAEAVTVSGQQLVINKRVYKDFIVTNRSKLQSLEFVDKLRDHAVYSIQKKMQSNIITDSVPSASAPDHQIAFDSGTTLALADLLEGKELLDDQDVSEDMRKMIAAVAQLNDLFNISGFTSRDYIPAGSPLSSGKIQTPVLGFEVMSTTVLSDVVYLFHPSYLTMAIQDQLNIEEFNLGVDGKRAARVNVDLLYGQKLLDDKRIVKIG